MKTPICDFVREYSAGNPGRLHMPGHKGRPLLGPEPLDITEIPGADTLYASGGIIRESEDNAASLFGSARTVYSAEGSSLCIRAMLYLAQMHAALQGRRARIAAGRNAHRVFLDAAALLDPELVWLTGERTELLSCRVSAEELEPLFSDPETAPTAVYLTSPDYLGHCTDLRPVAELCRRHGALLLADNAHGAYLRFLPGELHPLQQGADLCCDSAHKTLPVLTGGAYLHFGRSCPAELLPMAERAIALFASTSPSYLILQSLDAANAQLAGEYPLRLRETADLVRTLKAQLTAQGWRLAETEPLKITLLPKEAGYTGQELAALLAEKNLICEFADPDALVLMITPETGPEVLRKLRDTLSAVERRAPITSKAPAPGIPNPVMSPHRAMMQPFEEIPVGESVGRILAGPSVSCPPAVPVVLCGERIDEAAVRLFRYYGIQSCLVVKE